MAPVTSQPHSFGCYHEAPSLANTAIVEVGWMEQDERTDLEIPFRYGASGMHHAVGDLFTVKGRNLLQDLVVFKQHRACEATSSSL